MSSLMSRATANGVSKPLTRAENAKLHERMLTDDRSARDRLIEGNMALVTYRVERYIKQMPNVEYLRDDLLSEGMVGLIKGVDSLGRCRTPPDRANVTGYLSNAIQRHLAHYIDSEATIPVPDRTQRHKRLQDEVLEKPKCLGEPIAQDQVAASDPIAVMELQEEIEACCADKVDLQIVRRAAMGCSDHEIATALDIPRKTINNRRAAIYDRFLERTGMQRR